ncbi:UNVERIFIED_CONTAM: SLC13 family permease [Microbacterium sp. SLM126]
MTASAAYATPMIWAVAALATAGVLFRPFRLPEPFWAMAGAVLLCVAGLLPWRDALQAVARGNDVYLFLAGMMLISELARKTGLFDHVAALAVRSARGSARRLFVLVYGFGIAVTAFMSNDATAVVLTPAVLAATRAARVRHPLPYLYACAFIANAASFVLPISNPASRTRRAASRSSTRLSAPLNSAAVSGKWRPMSPSAAAPNSASVTACSSASASEWPSRPRSWGMSTPPRISLRPGTRACTS